MHAHWDFIQILITSAVLLEEKRLKKLYDKGLDHVQISIQDTEPENSNKIAGFKGSQ